MRRGIFHFFFLNWREKEKTKSWEGYFPFVLSQLTRKRENQELRGVFSISSFSIVEKERKPRAERSIFYFVFLNCREREKTKSWEGGIFHFSIVEKERKPRAARSIFYFVFLNCREREKTKSWEEYILFLLSQL